MAEPDRLIPPHGGYRRLKSFQVARSSLEELRMDYRDFLRQRGLAEWTPEHPALVRFKARRCASLEQVQKWVREERRRAKDTDTRTDTDSHGRTRTKAGAVRSVPVRGGPCSSQWRSAELVANGALSLPNVCCRLLDRQLAAQAAAFEKQGGFTERLYRVRRHRRGQP
jgi:four helix bundle suffix protein